MTLFLLLALNVPTNLAATCDGMTLTVNWSPVAGAGSYYVRVDYLGNNTGDTWMIAEPPDFYRDKVKATTFTAPAAPGEYAWWVHGFNATEGVGPSASSKFVCPKLPPDVTFTFKPGGPIMLAWAASKTPGVRYNVYRADTSGAYTVPLNPQPLAVTHFRDDTAEMAKTYFYSVRAVALDGTESRSSNEYTATRKE